jgi:hypothetical protein
MRIEKRVAYGLCIFSLLFIEPAEFQVASATTPECVSTSCFDVVTNPLTGEIIGHGRSTHPGTEPRAYTGSKRRVTKKKPSRISKPVINPICTIDQLATFTCIKTTAPILITIVVPHTRVIPAKPKVISTDEVRRALPLARLGFQPGVGAVVNVPVIFWSGVATPAQFALALLGESVDVAMIAHFRWSWGDGSSPAMTSSPGAPFPDRSLTHTFLRPGRYQVSMLTTWSGSARLGQTSIAIVGAPIESLSQLEVVVGQAPTSLKISP